MLSRLSLFITPDTGPMHLAAALGTPLVALFGPSSPERWGPLSAKARIVRVDLPCSPCNRIRNPPARCQGGTPDCMDGIAVRRVIQEAAGLLSTRRVRSASMARADDLIIVGDARGVRRVRLGAYLDADLAERAEREANAWVKSLRGSVVDGLPLPRALHASRRFPLVVRRALPAQDAGGQHVFRTLLALEALVARERPAQTCGAAGSATRSSGPGARRAERDGMRLDRRRAAPGAAMD